MTFEAAKQKCEKYGQEHVLKYYNELSEQEKEALLTQIDETDMSILGANWVYLAMPNE